MEAALNIEHSEVSNKAKAVCAHFVEMDEQQTATVLVQQDVHFDTAFPLGSTEGPVLLPAPEQDAFGREDGRVLSTKIPLYILYGNWKTSLS